MNRSARSVLRKLGPDQELEAQRLQFLEREAQEAQERAARSGDETSPGLPVLPPEMLSESEKRHEKYRRQQAVAGRFAPAAWPVGLNM